MKNHMLILVQFLLLPMPVPTPIIRVTIRQTTSKTNAIRKNTVLRRDVHTRSHTYSPQFDAKKMLGWNGKIWN